MVSETLERLGVRAGEDLLVALSGGADSLALTSILSGLQTGRSGRLTAAHLDHAVRGESSARDALSVLEMCRKMGVPLVTGLLRVEDVRETRGRLRSMEAALREMRYRFLRESARKVGARWILTGHQADDQAETVLFRTLRGMDWRSLGGIREREGQVLRPLLGVFRSEIRGYCDTEGLIPLEDPSNFDLAHSRNRLRHLAIPGLNRMFQVDVPPLLVRLGKAAAALAEFESKTIDRLAGKRLDLSVGSVDRSIMTLIPRCLVEGAVIRMLRSVAAGHPKKPLVLQFVRCLEKGAGKVKLSGQLEIEVHRDRVVLGYGPCLNDGSKPFRERKWQIPGRVDLPEPGAFLTASEAPYNGQRRFPSGPEALVSKERLKTPLSVRNRRPGDRFQPLGMARSKLLKRFLIDRKIPRSDRDKLPVVTDRNGAIIWVGGVEISQRIALEPGIPCEAYLLRLNFSGKKSHGKPNGGVN